MKNRGFSLIELLVVTAVSTIVIAGFMGMMSVIYNQLKMADGKFNVVGLAQEARNALTDRNTCRTMLNPVRVVENDKTALSIVLPGNRPLHGNLEFKNDKFKVREFYMETPVNMGAATPGNQLMSSRIYLSASGLDDADGHSGVMFQPHLVTNLMFVRRSSDGAVIDCSGLTDAGAMCLSLGGTYDQASNRCNLASNPEKSCTDLGGTYNQTTQRCSLTADYRGTCEGMGGTWENSRCVFRTIASNEPQRPQAPQPPSQPLGTCRNADVMQETVQGVPMYGIPPVDPASLGTTPVSGRVTGDGFCQYTCLGNGQWRREGCWTNGTGSGHDG